MDQLRDPVDGKTDAGRRAHTDRESAHENSRLRTISNHSMDPVVASRVPTPSVATSTGQPLPIEPYRKELIEAISNHGLLVIVGETGSGKTTQIPQYILGHDPNARIVVTQPRRIAAISNAKRVAEEMGERNVGNRVGYAIRFEAVVSPATQLRYVTDGVLLRELVDDGALSAYDVVIVDEAHERTVGTDLLLGLLKQCKRTRPDLKLLIMSATLDVEKFSDFFDGCPIFQIPGRPYPVEIMYARNMRLAALQSSFVDRAVDTVLHIHRHERPGDVLVFLTGSQDIERAVTATQKLDAQLDYRRDVAHYHSKDPDGRRVVGMSVFGLYASLETGQQREIFVPARLGYRKVVFATNIAQTSITIPGIVFVVDCAFVKQKLYDPVTHMDALVVTPISQAAATQRAGRAGRTEPGKAYRLYSHEAFSDLSPNTEPEIQRSALLDTVLALKAMNVHNVQDFDFVDAPNPDLLAAALRDLYLLGALDDPKGLGPLTPLGKQLMQLPVSPWVGRALVAAATEFKCAREMLVISAMLSVESVWVELRGKVAADSKRQAQVHELRRQFFDRTGDHLTLYNVYSAWRDHDYSRSWCRENMLHHRALEQAQKIKRQLESILDKWSVPDTSARDPTTSRLDPVPILRALCTAYYPNLAKKQVGRPVFYQYAVHHGKRADSDALMALAIHPTSALAAAVEKDDPRVGEIEWVLYHDIMYTTRANMRFVSRIWRWEWVEPYVPRLDHAMAAALAAEGAEDREEKVERAAATESEKAPSASGAEDAQKAKRDAAIAAARERALKRRRIG
ncbi:DEAH-box ATP-dependent RNA helicase prp22 [Allomyces javanicus]|nr:DEAH-box ATP-dependent RNA helicase prp22 [Allomyces javanicus]